MCVIRSMNVRGWPTRTFFFERSGGSSRCSSQSRRPTPDRGFEHLRARHARPAVTETKRAGGCPHACPGSPQLWTGRRARHLVSGLEGPRTPRRKHLKDRRLPDKRNAGATLAPDLLCDQRRRGVSHDKRSPDEAPVKMRQRFLGESAQPDEYGWIESILRERDPAAYRRAEGGQNTGVLPGDALLPPGGFSLVLGGLRCPLVCF